jgi:hypothetical protein
MPVIRFIVQPSGVFLGSPAAHRPVHVTFQEFLNIWLEFQQLASYFFHPAVRWRSQCQRMTVLRPTVSNVSTRRQSLLLTSNRLAEPVCITTVHELAIGFNRASRGAHKKVETYLQYKAKGYRK